MTHIVAVLVFFLMLTAMATIAYKWTGLNPHRIEDGPTWLSALWSGFQASLTFYIAIAMTEGPHTKTASFLYYYACGSVFAPAFWTTFTPSPAEEPNFIVRWWKGKLNRFSDGIFKSLFTIPLALLITLFMESNALFWATVLLALTLSIGKMGTTLLIIDAGADSALVRQRRRMLILGNVIATAVIGTTAMLCWVWLTHTITDKFPPVRFTDYVTVLGLLAGILFHTI